MKTMLVLVITLLMTANSWADGPHSNESDECVNCRRRVLPGAPDVPVPVDTSAITHTSRPWHNHEDPVYQDMSPAAAGRLIADYRGLGISGRRLIEEGIEGVENTTGIWLNSLCSGRSSDIRTYNRNRNERILGLFATIGNIIDTWRGTTTRNWLEPENFRFIVMWWNEYGEQVECNGEPLLKQWLRTRRSSPFHDYFLFNSTIQANRASIPYFDVTSSNDNYPDNLKILLRDQVHPMYRDFNDSRRTATVD